MLLNLRKEFLTIPLMVGVGVLAYQMCSTPPLEEEVSFEEVTRCPLPKLEKTIEHDCLDDRPCVSYD